MRTPLISPARFISQNAPGRLAVSASFLSFSSLLVASLSHAPSLSPPLHTWLPDLFLSLCCWKHKPQCFFPLILFFDDVLRIHLAGYTAVFLGLKAACTCLKNNRLRRIPLIKQVLSAPNRLNFLFSYLMQSSFYTPQDSGLVVSTN